MEITTISEMVKSYKAGNPNAMEDVWVQMQPLLRGTANKTFFMELDDAYQEYSEALIEAIIKIPECNNDGQCITYFQICIHNRFCSLCHRREKISAEFLCDNELLTEIVSCSSSYNQALFEADLQRYINQIASAGKRKIAELLFLKHSSSSKIAKTLELSP